MDRRQPRAPTTTFAHMRRRYRFPHRTLTRELPGLGHGSTLLPLPTRPKPIAQDFVPVPFGHESASVGVHRLEYEP